MIPIWLDCDPGHDDAVAILLAAKLPEFQLLGISTVFGNAPLSKTTVNAKAVLKALGEDVPVYAGAEGPVGESGGTESATYAPSIHGESGLDGTDLIPTITETIKPDLQGTLKAMADSISAYKGSISLVATGSLTNVAELFKYYPETKHQIKYLSIMGGGIELGNWTEHAEFNIWSDAKAAKYVLEDPVLAPKTIVAPLDVTHTVIATNEVLQSINSIGTTTSRMFYELISFFAETYKTQFGFDDGPPVHDPLAVAVLLNLYNDDLECEFTNAGIIISIEGEKLGKTSVAESGPALRILKKIDLVEFWKLVVTALELVPEDEAK